MAKGSRGGRRAKAKAGKGKSEELKLGDEAYIPEWFQDKMKMPGYVMPPEKGRIVGETEKAWKLDIYAETLDGEREFYFQRWIPKSVAKSDDLDGYLAHMPTMEDFAKGKQKYNKMLDFAKSKGVKGVRVGLRKETILKKIKDAGLDYKY